MSQFTLRDAVSSRAFLVFSKSDELRRGGSEIRNLSQTSWRVRLEHTVFYAPGKARVAGPHCGTAGAVVETSQGRETSVAPAIAIVEIVDENSVLEFWQSNWFRGKVVHGAPAFQLDLTPYHEALLTQLYNDWLKKTYSAAELEHLRNLAGLHAGEPFSLTQRRDFSKTSKELFYAEARFYTHLETSFLEDMRS
jgi:hypothetical protein